MRKLRACEFLKKGITVTWVLGCICLACAPTHAREPSHGFLFEANRDGQRIYMLGAMHTSRHEGELPSHVRRAIEQSSLVLHERHDLAPGEPLDWIPEFQLLSQHHTFVPQYRLGEASTAFLSQWTSFNDAAWGLFSQAHPMALVRTFTSMRLLSAKTAVERHKLTGALGERVASIEGEVLSQAARAGARVARVEPRWASFQFWIRDCSDVETNTQWLDSQVELYKNWGRAVEPMRQLGDAILSGDLQSLRQAEDQLDQVASNRALLARCLGNNRNRAWIGQMQAEIARLRNPTVFLVAGASHLIDSTSPDHTLLALAQSAGYRLSRVCAKTNIAFVYVGLDSLPDCEKHEPSVRQLRP